MKNNIGRIITDGYCNGFFGRDYDFFGAVIVAEAPEYLVIKKADGRFDFCSFQDYDWHRNEDGTLNGDGIKNLTCMSEDRRQELIDSWCSTF